MSILTIIPETGDIEKISAFAIKTALALDEDLYFLSINRGTDKKNKIIWKVLNSCDLFEDETHVINKLCLFLNNQSENEYPNNRIKFDRYTSANPLECILEEIKKEKFLYTIVVKEIQTPKSDSFTTLAREVFYKSPSNVIMYRPGGVKLNNDSKILIPTAGGPHSQTALKLGKHFLDNSNKSLSALFIEPKIGEIGKAVGHKFLDKILSKAKLKENEQVQPVVVLEDNIFSGIKKQLDKDNYDLLLIGASNIGFVRRVLFDTVPNKLMEGKDGISIAVIRTARPALQRIKEKIEDIFDFAIPQLQREERITLFEALQTRCEWNFDFLALMVLSTAIASIGLIQDSSAVVIGAMLVAPLMTPLLGSGLALVQGNLPLLKSASRSIFFGFFTALIVAFLIGIISPIANLTPELTARGAPSLLDMLVALLSGVAAAHCSARPGLSAALPGVAIAAALVPPLATIGIASSLGEIEIAKGATLLFSTNIVAIILGALCTFYAAGIRNKNELSVTSAWAKRGIISLILILSILAVPLGSVILNRFSEINLGKDRSIQEIHKIFEKKLKFSGKSLSKFEIHENNNQKHLIIEVISPNIISNELQTDLLNLSKEKLHENVKLEIRTKLITTLN